MIKGNPNETMSGAIRNKLCLLTIVLAKLEKDEKSKRDISKAVKEICELCDIPIMSKIYPYK